MKDWCWRIALGASPCADASLAALGTLDQREALRRIDVPALVFVGTRDGVVAPEIGRTSATLLQKARLVEFPECGHAPLLEDPVAYHAALLDFLRSLPDGRA